MVCHVSPYKGSQGANMQLKIIEEVKSDQIWEMYKTLVCI
jgi:hypothetical protein